MNKANKYKDPCLSALEIANHYWLPQDDEVIFKELLVEERVASVQLLVKYMPEILSIAQELYSFSKDKEKIMAEVIRCFLENLSFSYVDHYHRHHDKPYSLIRYLNTVKAEMLDQLRGDTEKMNPHCFSISQLDSLNRLNDVLRKRQIELWAFIDEQMSYLEGQINRDQTILNHCELKLDIHFYISKNSQHIHSMTLKINLNNRQEMASKMNNLGFDWWMKGIPMLEKPYSYLLAQLFEQWQIVHRIPDIVIVWTTVKKEFQSSLFLKNNQWMMVDRNDFWEEQNMGTDL